MTQATKSTISLGTGKRQRWVWGIDLHTLRIGVRGTYLSWVKMYPSTSFVAAKMAPTAMQSTPEKQSKALSSGAAKGREEGEKRTQRTANAPAVPGRSPAKASEPADGLTCADQAGGGGSLGRVDVAGTQRVPHLHTGGCGEPQGDLKPQG